MSHKHRHSSDVHTRMYTYMCAHTHTHTHTTATTTTTTTTMTAHTTQRTHKHTEICRHTDPSTLTHNTHMHPHMHIRKWHTTCVHAYILVPKYVHMQTNMYVHAHSLTLTCTNTQFILEAYSVQTVDLPECDGEMGQYQATTAEAD